MIGLEDLVGETIETEGDVFGIGQSQNKSLTELAQVGNRRSPVDTDACLLVFHMARMAGRAGEPDQIVRLFEGVFRLRFGETDRKAVWIAGVGLLAVIDDRTVFPLAAIPRLRGHLLGTRDETEP